jgi:phosphinothricin acetyltransferase
MPAPFAIRDSQPADIPAIAAIYAHYVATSTATFEEVPPPPEEMAQRRAELTAAGLPFVVASDAAEGIIGYAYAAPFRPRSGYRFTLEDSIYLAPSALRRGIGSALLAQLIECCTAGGYRQIVAVIGDTAHAASIRLHQKLGFARVGLMPAVGFKFGRWIDVVTMQRALGAGAAALPDR